jgi:hypothetical protein
MSRAGIQPDCKVGGHSGAHEGVRKQSPVWATETAARRMDFFRATILFFFVTRGEVECEKSLLLSWELLGTNLQLAVDLVQLNWFLIGCIMFKKILHIFTHDKSRKSSSSISRRLKVTLPHPSTP